MKSVWLPVAALAVLALLCVGCNGNGEPTVPDRAPDNGTPQPPPEARSDFDELIRHFAGQGILLKIQDEVLAIDWIEGVEEGYRYEVAETPFALELYRFGEPITLESFIERAPVLADYEPGWIVTRSPYALVVIAGSDAEPPSEVWLKRLRDVFTSLR